MQRFASAAAAAAGLSGRELTVLLVGKDRMAQLNSQFRGKNYATDVLSFEGGGVPAGGYLGDIVICPAVAARSEALLSRELKVLILHGILHLIGYDHESDRGQMRRLELRLRRRLGLR